MGRTPKWWKPKDEKQREMFEKYRDEVRCALQTYKDGVCLGSVTGLLREFLGEDVPYREIGFNTLSEFFFHMDDIFEVRMYAPYIYNSSKKFIFLKQSAINEKSKHIGDLVSNQVSGSKRKGEPKPSYNNTIRVDSDSILAFPRMPANQAASDQSRGQFQMRNHPYSNNASQGQKQRMPLMGYNRPNAQRNLLRPNLTSSNQRWTPLLKPTQAPRSLNILQENGPIPQVPVSRLSLKNLPLPGIPPLRYVQTVDAVDSTASVSRMNGNSTSDGSIHLMGEPTPLLQVPVRTLPRGPSLLPTQHSDQVDSGNTDRLKSRVTSIPLQPEMKNAFDMTPLRSAVETPGSTPLGKNQGSVFRNPDHFFAGTGTNPTGQAYAYHGPRSYPTYNVATVPRVEIGPNSRTARLARVVESNMANDNDNYDNDEYEDYFSDSSSEEFGVVLPGETTLLTKSGSKESLQPQSIISAGNTNINTPGQKSLHHINRSENEQQVQRSHSTEANGQKENQWQTSQASAVGEANQSASGAGDSTHSTEDGFPPYTLPPEDGSYFCPDSLIAFEEIEVGKTELRITQVNSSLDFMVIRSNKEKLMELNELTADMSGWYHFQLKKKSLPPIEHKLDKGLYAGYCEDTKSWRRVQIDLSDDDEEGYTTAFFIDYGILKTIRLDAVHFLKKVHCKLPRQAFFAEADFAKMNSPKYNLRKVLEQKLFNAVGVDLVANVQHILSSESIVPLLTIDFNNALNFY